MIKVLGGKKSNREATRWRAKETEFRRPIRKLSRAIQGGKTEVDTKKAQTTDSEKRKKKRNRCKKFRRCKDGAIEFWEIAGRATECK